MHLRVVEHDVDRSAGPAVDELLESGATDHVVTLVHRRDRRGHHLARLLRHHHAQVGRRWRVLEPKQRRRDLVVLADLHAARQVGEVARHQLDRLVRGGVHGIDRQLRDRVHALVAQFHLVRRRRRRAARGQRGDEDRRSRRRGPHCCSASLLATDCTATFRPSALFSPACSRSANFGYEYCSSGGSTIAPSVLNKLW